MYLHFYKFSCAECCMTGTAVFIRHLFLHGQGSWEMLKEATLTMSPERLLEEQQRKPTPRFM